MIDKALLTLLDVLWSPELLRRRRLHKVVFYVSFRVICLLSPGERWAESKGTVDELYKHLTSPYTRLAMMLRGE